MNSKEIRKSFIKFFENKGHHFLRSSPVLPIDDPTLLFTNAGMNQFKPIFLNEETPPYLRVVNSQKCIRVSGKHNDLDEVGLDTYHHTFFEMLGNWSFGDYYKSEAIQWAWELLTGIWKLDKNRIWVTVYETDAEAFKIWETETDIDPARILKFGKKENFWEMGPVGPCGPCSEIHYYMGNDLSQQAAEGINSNSDYWELWNLVFIQNNRLADGSLSDLPEKHVDTGAGFERLVSVLQNKNSNYETDLFLPIIRKIEKLAGKSYKKNPVPFQVIADHVRMLSFSIADGGLPSNEGRGYVLRRILRRAARFGRMLGFQEPFIYKLVDTVGRKMSNVYPEILEKQAHIENVVKAEEISFNGTLDRGLSHFEKMLKHVSGGIISGKQAFKLYDTYGFPLDLTRLMARENNLELDENGFSIEMKTQKKKSQAAGKFNPDTLNIEWVIVSSGKNSIFKGYETLTTKSKIRKYSSGQQIYLVLDQTPFYAESGGQIGDRGNIMGKGINLKVEKVFKDGETFVHVCSGKFDIKQADSILNCRVDEERRQTIRKNHTATHLLQAALRQVLGQHVQQAGSLVHPDYLRFDLTHFEKVKPEDLRQIETLVNNAILLNTNVNVSVKSFESAKKDGAIALFGEKYGNEVRVVSIGEYSKELCGGTHVERTGDIGIFKIIEESSLAAGVRRLLALTGPKALEYIQDQASIIGDLQLKLNCSRDEISGRVEQILKHGKKLEKDLINNKISDSKIDGKSLVSASDTIGNFTVVIQKVKANSLGELKVLGDQLFAAIKSGIGVIGSQTEEKPALVVVVSKNLVEKGVKAGEIAHKLGLEMGGGGGGKPHFATAGGNDPKKLESTLEAAHTLLKNILKNL
ncbi:MAG: alanine--tRNA ligase [Candidatus Neomarinimicrobiota bacterium]